MKVFGLVSSLTKSRLVSHSDLGFLQSCPFYSSSDWSSRTFSKVIDGITVRSVSKTLLMTNKYVRRLSVLWTTAVQRDGPTVAPGVHVVVVHTPTTHVSDDTTPNHLRKTL